MYFFNFFLMNGGPLDMGGLHLFVRNINKQSNNHQTLNEGKFCNEH